MAKTKVCVAFDGVFHSPTPGHLADDVVDVAPIYGSIDWLRRVMSFADIDVHIFSARVAHHPGFESIVGWLYRHGLKNDVARLKFTAKRPSDCLVIDYRHRRFDGSLPTINEIFNKFGSPVDESAPDSR